MSNAGWVVLPKSGVSVRRRLGQIYGKYVGKLGSIFAPIRHNWFYDSGDIDWANLLQQRE